MSETTYAIKKIADGILLAIEKKIKDAPYDRTIKCRITEVLTDNKYKVSINGVNYTVKSKNTYVVNDLVYVMIPQNNYSELFILQ